MCNVGIDGIRKKKYGNSKQDLLNFAQNRFSIATVVLLVAYGYKLNSPQYPTVFNDDLREMCPCNFIIILVV